MNNNYQIKNIKNYQTNSQPYYFLDANVWIAVLSSSVTNKIKEREAPYIAFFEEIIEKSAKPSAKLKKILKKQGLYTPKIAMTSMLMSEIFNTYMRNIAMPLCMGEDGAKQSNYKRDYRGTKDHDEQLEELKENFLDYYDYMHFVDDDLNALNPKEICNSINSKSDFNDLYYCALMSSYGIPIVTHDRDFITEKVEIITSQRALLDLKN